MSEKNYKIENEEGLVFTVQETHPVIDNGKAKRALPSEITFVIEDVSKDKLQPDGCLVLSLTKKSSINLAIQLLAMASDPIPEVGLQLNCYEDNVIIYQGLLADRKPSFEPYISVAVSENEIFNDGTFGFTIDKDAVPEAIKALAKIMTS